MVYFIFNNLFRDITRRHCCTKSTATKNTVNKKLVLYGDEVSPPVRFVLMTAAVLDIKPDYHNIDLFKAENKSSFFKKINPLQKVPALQVGDDVICDSHAIALYLCQIGDGQCLYPEDAITRARVNQAMFFNSSTLFPIDSFIFAKYFSGHWSTEKLKIQEWYSAVDHLEYLLSNRAWLACDQVTLADLCCATTVSSVQLLVPPLNRHVNVKQWLDRLQKLSCYEMNSVGLERLKNMIHSFKKNYIL